MDWYSILIQRNLKNMMHSKNNAGFTLLETLFSLVIMALVLSPIFLVQGTVAQRVGRFARHIEKMMQAKLFLVEAPITVAKTPNQTTLEKKVESTTLKFELKKMGDDSAFKKIKNLYRQQVVFEWNELGKPQSDALVLFVYKPESAKKEQA